MCIRVRNRIRLFGCMSTCILEHFMYVFLDVFVRVQVYSYVYINVCILVYSYMPIKVFLYVIS